MKAEITPALVKHIEKNKDKFEFWIKRNEKLQPSADVLQLIIPEFEKANPGAKAINGCPDCIIDMLRWALIQIKKEDKK